MRLLVIDTSGPDCAAGIFDADGARMLARCAETIGKGHAERLPGMIEQVSRDAGLPLKALDRIAVTVGPGSFTGIRVGVAMARAGTAGTVVASAVMIKTLAACNEAQVSRR